MKYLCTFYIITTLYLIPNTKAAYRDDILAVGKLCQDESKVTTKELDAFYKGSLDPAVGTDPIKRHMKCIMEQRGYFKNSKFDLTGFHQIVEKLGTPKDIATFYLKVADLCKDTKGTSDYDTAFKVFICFKDNKAILGFAREFKQ